MKRNSISKIHIDTVDEDEEEMWESDDKINWSELIFLPFNPIFKFLVLCTAITKCILGPLHSVYPLFNCLVKNEHEHFSVTFIRIFYLYVCDPVYALDMVLHIMHRQVTEQAMKREYMPKKIYLIVLDIVALIPLFRLYSKEQCPSVQIIPNIYSFAEFVCVYRIVQYFAVFTTHSKFYLVLGSIVIFAVVANCGTSLFLLLTYEGLCDSCPNKMHDWRAFVQHKINETDENLTTYVYASTYVISFSVNKLMDLVSPTNISEILIANFLMAFGRFVYTFVLLPKMFSEAILSWRRIMDFLPCVQRKIEETQSKNPNKQTHAIVENFYAFIWKKRSGITSIPEINGELPRYLRLEIRMDLVWQVFFHSPTFRNTSEIFKRYLCNYIHLDYKLPGEIFFAGPHAHSNLYYIKSGIVQIMSNDDGITPIISLGSGTLIGDVNFYIPHLEKNLRVKCETYCEVFYISRNDILTALHLFPNDRSRVLLDAKNRIKHARTLYTCKQNIRGLDRSEDEGINWVRKRWKEISESINEMKIKLVKKETFRYELPPEESVYHCSKYLGQLVLCNEAQLNKKSLFAIVEFPWIFNANTQFNKIWKRIVVWTVYGVLLSYPYLMSRKVIPKWFTFFQFWTDLVYAGDILIKLLTMLPQQEDAPVSVSDVIFSRCKTPTFWLDVLATVWLERYAVIIGEAEYFYLCIYNRLLKVYVLFSTEYQSDFDVKVCPLDYIFYQLALLHFCVAYIYGFLLFLLYKYVPNFNKHFWLGMDSSTYQEPTLIDVFSMTYAWIFKTYISEPRPMYLIDIYLAIALYVVYFILLLYSRTTIIASLYLKMKQMTEYQSFVSHVIKHFKSHKIHPDLLTCLNRYLTCQWKHYYGMDVMYSYAVRNDPYDIYWHVHGEIAVKLIGESQAFMFADQALVRDLGSHCKFLTLPAYTTLVLFGVQCKNVTWLYKGHITSEYYDSDGNVISQNFKCGEILSPNSVFFGTSSMCTYTTDTDCEILYVRRNIFFTVLRYYRSENNYIDSSVRLFRKKFGDMYNRTRTRRESYLKTMDQQSCAHSNPIHSKQENKTSFWNYSNWWIHPSSRFSSYWAFIRAVSVFASIVLMSLSTSQLQHPVHWMCVLFDTVAYMDMLLRVFLAYYDKNGVLITNTTMRVTNYLSKGFILDLIGTMPWAQILTTTVTHNVVSYEYVLMLNTACKFARLYLLIGYMNYLADTPTISAVYFKILKWQILIILLIFAVSHFLLIECFEYPLGQHGYSLSDIKLKSRCWLPNYVKVNKHPTEEQLKMVTALSFALAQCTTLRMNQGLFTLNRNNIFHNIFLFSMGILYWYMVCYTLALLCLCRRANTLFFHRVNQLRKFLEAERVEKEIVKRVKEHFRYRWIRTGGVNLQRLIYERVGVIFRQDLSSYFCKNTLKALNTILKGDDDLQRKIAGVVTQHNYMAGEDIARELDLFNSIAIVHRGVVRVSQGGKQLQILKMGSIFGQLTETTLRPIKVTATAFEHADILQMRLKTFHEIIGSEVAKTIKNQPEHENDYISVKEHFPVDPYNTIRYILRRRKIVHLPWMKRCMDKKSKKYFIWLLWCWFIDPIASCVLVCLIKTVDEMSSWRIIYCLILFDFIQIGQLYSDFYTMRLRVVNQRISRSIMRFSVLKQLGFHVTIFSIVVPMFTFLGNDMNYQLARLVRMKFLFDFEKHFCRNFQTHSDLAVSVMNLLYFKLVVHAMVCLWIRVSCFYENGAPIPTPTFSHGTLNKTNLDEWSYPPSSGKFVGCIRISPLSKDVYNNTHYGYLIPNVRENDYIVAMTYIYTIFTHTDLDFVIPLTASQTWCKVAITHILSLVKMWVMSIAVGAVYVKLRELYDYDFSTINLVKYLEHAGLMPALLDSVKEYTQQLWQRESGNWVPELAYETPMCLREDILGALYMHHLDNLPLIKDVPFYFKRQLVTRLHRVVLFPGKVIIKEGEIFSCLYLVHEGQVDRWQTNISGERIFVSTLTTCGFFGLNTCLYPNTTHTHTYTSKTVVDLLYLRHRDWQDLLNSYPDIKTDLYEAAALLKNKE